MTDANQIYTDDRSALERGNALAARLNPQLRAVLEPRYEHLVPGFTDTLIEFAYGRLYSREGLDVKTRQIATVAALTALGGQTGPQLKINIEHSLAVGVSEKEIVEIILQMSVYGGMPAAINGLNAAIEVFEAKKAA
jgi:4-carboxymuconolactone decarboxylase